MLPASVQAPNLKTAANLPPELFPLILDYIGTDDRGDGSLSERRDSGLHDWQACSLVCLYWANHCRRYMFYYLINNLHSKDQLDALRRLINSKGSNRLTPIGSLVARPTLRIQQTWDTRSWIHHLHPLPLKNTTCHLTLRGPVPTSLPNSAFRSPHWSLPRTMPAQYTPHAHCAVQHIAFPSFRDITLLMRHFRNASSFSFEDLTWPVSSDQGDVDVFVRPFPVTPDSFDQEYKWAYSIEAIRCTDNMRVLDHARRLYPDFPLSHIQEVVPMQRFLRAFYDAGASASKGRENGLACSIEWHLEDRQVNFTMYDDTGLIGLIKWHFGAKQALGVWPLTGLLLGLWHHTDTSLHALPSSSHFPATAFRDLIARFASLELIVFGFGDTETMERVIGDHPALVRPSEVHQRCFFAVRSSQGESEPGAATMMERDGSETESQERPELDGEEWSVGEEFVGDGDGEDAMCWRILEPTTMQPTGDVFGGLDEVLSGLTANLWVREQNAKKKGTCAS